MTWGWVLKLDFSKLKHCTTTGGFGCPGLRKARGCFTGYFTEIVPLWRNMAKRYHLPKYPVIQRWQWCPVGRPNVFHQPCRETWILHFMYSKRDKFPTKDSFRKFSLHSPSLKSQDLWSEQLIGKCYVVKSIQFPEHFTNAGTTHSYFLQYICIVALKRTTLEWRIPKI